MDNVDISAAACKLVVEHNRQPISNIGKFMVVTPTGDVRFTMGQDDLKRMAVPDDCFACKVRPHAVGYTWAVAKIRQGLWPEDPLTRNEANDVLAGH